MPVSWGVPTSVPPAPKPGDRALRPVRWPHPGWPTIAMILLWVVAVLIAVLLPALIVPPVNSTATGGEVLLALGCTLLGAALMVVVGMVLHKWHDHPLAWSFGLVPAITLLILGLIMAATKYFGGG